MNEKSWKAKIISNVTVKPVPPKQSMFFSYYEEAVNDYVHNQVD